MTAEHTINTPGAPETLRPLDSYERLFWTLDKVNGFNFSIVVSFRGTIARSYWRAAFAQAQKKHPFLNVSLNQDDPHAPTFTRVEGSPVPIAFQRRTSPTQWQRVMEFEVAKLFDQSTAPLLRAVLLEDDEGCDLILTANHTIVDGIGVLALVRDLFAALSGEMLASSPVPPSAEDRVAQVTSSTQFLNPQNVQQDVAGKADAKDSVAARPIRSFACRKRTDKPEIGAIRLSPDQTMLLLGCSRQQQTTVGAVLLAALATALRRLSPALKEADIHLATPIDARPYLHNQADFVLSVATARAVSPHPDTGLWASARALRSQLAPFQSIAAIGATYKRAQAVLATNLKAPTLVKILVQQLGYDVLLSNLKNVEFPPAPHGLTVDAVWGPSVLWGIEGEHMIGAATFGGALHLTYTSYTPVTGLLEAVQQIIESACEDA